MKYKGYEINQDSSNFAPQELIFYYTEEDEEEIVRIQNFTIKETQSMRKY
jgi:hypothetical protein